MSTGPHVIAEPLLAAFLLTLIGFLALLVGLVLGWRNAHRTLVLGLSGSGLLLVAIAVILQLSYWFGGID